uniref:Uncharacterized protein n=1 Tax=Arion vulgaris TaxID=1028688 RepID=A0A0B7B7X6_9EUPU
MRGDIHRTPSVHKHWVQTFTGIRRLTKESVQSTDVIRRTEYHDTGNCKQNQINITTRHR